MSMPGTHTECVAACHSESTRHAAILRPRQFTVSARAAAAASLVLALLPGAGLGGTTEEAEQILEAAGVTGGLVVHLGCGDGQLTAALRANEGFVVHTTPASATSYLPAVRLRV